MANLKERVEFIQSRAEALAARYKSAQDYQDLIQEGVLVGLELLEQGVDDDKKLIGAMRRRMNDYHNYDNRTVAIPSSGASRAAMATITRGDPTNCESSLLRHGDSPLMQALMNSYAVSLDDCNLTTEDSHTQDYETEEFIQHVLLTMEECLDSKTYDVVSAVYLHGVTQETVAQELGVTQQYVNQVLKFGLQKIKGELEK